MTPEVRIVTHKWMPTLKISATFECLGVRFNAIFGSSINGMLFTPHCTKASTETMFIDVECYKLKEFFSLYIYWALKLHTIEFCLKLHRKNGFPFVNPKCWSWLEFIHFTAQKGKLRPLRTEPNRIEPGLFMVISIKWAHHNGNCPRFFLLECKISQKIRLLAKSKHFAIDCANENRCGLPNCWKPIKTEN